METKALEQSELVNEIIDVIASEGMVDREKDYDGCNDREPGFESIDIVILWTALEDKFDVYIPMDGPFHEAKDVKSLIDAVAAYIAKRKSSEWVRPSGSLSPAWGLFRPPASGRRHYGKRHETAVPVSAR